MSPVDAANQPAPVRAEDAFDVAALAQWLRAETSLPLSGAVQVQQFRGGASNLTYQLSWPGETFIMRRPPRGVSGRGAHDMGHEYAVQQALTGVFPFVPTLVAYCADTSVIGSEFYVMRRIEGSIPRLDLPASMTESDGDLLCRRLFDTLVSLHQVDVSTPELAGLGRGSGYVARQVSGWARRLEAARTDDLGDWTPITAWLDAQQPPDVRTCLIHNDWRLDNVVLDPADPTRIVGVLDWEMATLGDPLMDLGCALAYWVQADDEDLMRLFRRQASDAPGMWNREQIVEHYAAQMGFGVTAEQWRFYEVFGLFRLAVILQQIWARFVSGVTTNQAFSVFGDAVAYLESRSHRIVGER